MDAAGSVTRSLASTPPRAPSAGRPVEREPGHLRPVDGYTPGLAAPKPRPPIEHERIEDALIIGAGPGGLAAAVKLAERGIAVTVVEIRSDDYQRPHHLNLRQGTLDSLEDLRAFEPVMDASGWIIAEEHMGETTYPSTRPPDRDRVSADPVTLLSSDSVVQARISDIEKALYARALDLGVKFEFHTSAKLTEIKDGPNEGRYQVELQRMDDDFKPVGEPRSVGVPGLVVASDGANSKTREQLGIEFIEESEPTFYLGGHVNKEFGPFTRKLERPLPDGFVQRLMVTGHAKYPSAWVSVQVRNDMADRSQEDRVAHFCEGASAAMGVKVEPSDVVWGAGQVTRVQDRRAAWSIAGRNVVLLGDASRTGDVWASGGLNLSLTTDVMNLCKMVDEVNRGAQTMEDGLIRYHLRTRWASKAWHIIAGDGDEPASRPASAARRMR